MSLTLLLLILIFLACLVAAFGAWRRAPSPVDDLRRLLDEHQLRARGDQASALQPMQTELTRLNRDLASQKAEQEAALLRQFQEVQRQLGEGLQAGRKEQGERLGEVRKALDEGLAQSRRELGERVEAVQAQVQERLGLIQKSNEEKLEQMRLTVDEKLHDTLEKRLGESFTLVSQRLEEVHRGLGDMRALAQDVGGLKKVLGNVKTRGTLGEVLLEGLLEQFLAPGQWESQKVLKKDSREMVDFALRLPTPRTEPEVWIPLDAKFPKEEFERLEDARERGDAAAAERAGDELERTILNQAKSLREKYILPPTTTNYALLYLPTEGLYAEVVRRSGLWERLQREFQVVVLGPTTISAYLNMVQMGYTNLAISSRSTEVWELLSDVKKEFGTYGTWIAAVQKKLKAASDELEEKVGTRTRQMERKLRDIQTLPQAEALSLPYTAQESDGD